MAENGVPILTWPRRRPDSRTAIVFIHGFGGNAVETWDRFPDFVQTETALAGWDVGLMGYATGLMPGLLEGLWTGSPSLETLAGLLATVADTGHLRDYDALALVAHSMGGLIVQRALLDHEDLRSRVSHVFLYGTPSGGLEKASWFQRWKRQIKDMAAGGPFIQDLRTRWDETFAEPKFVFRAVAGDQDQFVPPRSSLGPFPKDLTSVVEGNHVSMVKPRSSDDLSVRVLVRGIQGEAAPEGPWNAAELALETLRFEDVIESLLPNANRLDARNLVTLAMALDGRRRGDEALEILERAGKKGTDAQGVRAGRLKRQWIREGTEQDAKDALRLYQDAYRTSVEGQVWDQAYYHGINVAFMTALYLGKPSEAADIATEVLGHCEGADTNHWSLATEGEALFYLGEWDKGFGKYAAALERRAGPREIGSMHQQAVMILSELAPREEQEALNARLKQVFGWE